MRTKALGCASLLLLGVASAKLSNNDNSGNVLSFVTFHPSRGRDMLGNPKKAHELEIDSALKVVWDTQAFYSYLSAAQAKVKGLVIFIPKLEGIRDAMNVFAEGQERRMAEALAQLNADLAEDQNTKGDAVLQLALATQHANAYTQEAETLLTQKAEQEPGFYQDLRAANAQAKGGDFSAMAQSIKDKADGVKDELNVGLANIGEYKIFMSARLISRTGGSFPVHLKDYDKVEEGEEKAFPRRQFVVDKRTRDALAAAQEIANLSREIGSGKLMERVRASFGSVRDRTSSLLKRLQVDVLETQLNDLVKKLQGVGDSNVVEILGEVRQIQYLVSPLSKSPILRQKSESIGLLKLADAIDSFSKHINKNILELPKRLASLDTRLRELIVAQPGIFESSLVDFFLDFRKSMMQETSSLNKLVAGFTKVSQILSVSGDVSESLADLVPKEIGTSESLDTEFNLKTLTGERHPGDKVEVTIKLMRAEPGATSDEVVEETKQTFRIEAYGAYIEPSGGLIFVDPRSSISRSLNFEPSLGLSFNYKYGMKGNSFWNHTLNPGIGLGFAMLDFDDNKKFELGISANVTLFNDLLWLGYGRNLGAKADYFYFGLNPLSLRSLFRR